jgi:nucleoside-diphosphate-sugar epimerase
LKSKILIIGGASGLGKQIQNYLKKKNKVFFSSSKKINKKNKNIAIKYDIFSKEDFNQLKNFIIKKKINIIFYCVGYKKINSLQDMIYTDLIVPVQLIEYLNKKIKYKVKFILSGSQSPYHRLSSENYQISKSMQYNLVKFYNDKSSRIILLIIKYGTLLFPKSKWQLRINKNSKILKTKKKLNFKKIQSYYSLFDKIVNLKKIKSKIYKI